MIYRDGEELVNLPRSLSEVLAERAARDPHDLMVAKAYLGLNEAQRLEYLVRLGELSRRTAKCRNS